MSYNNHDKDDPNAVRYAPSNRDIVYGPGNNNYGRNKLVTSTLLTKADFYNNIEKMLKYAGKYEISIQFWGDGDTNVFIAKDGTELTDFGGLNPSEAIEKTIEYLDRINPVG